MSEAGDAKAGGLPAAAAAPSHLRWDTSVLQTHRCTLATASATPNEIILNFGGNLRPGEAGEVGAALLRRIALTPRTAKHLSATLQRLIADHEGRRSSTA